MDSSRRQQQHRFGQDYDSPSRPLAGASRSAANPRIHAISKPYSRPTTTSSMPGTAFAESSTSPALSRSPSKQTSMSTRPRTGLPQSNSTGSLGSLTRSGSDTQLSLLSGIKSIFSRPLAWLATPARTKRDSLSSFGHDIEAADDGSPSAQASKRARRVSPPSARRLGEYEPSSHNEAIGRAVTGFMLPPLPPHISLTPRSHLHPGQADTEKPLPNRTNFSRPLTSSASMPYLDPPNGLFSSSSPAKSSGLAAKRNGPLTRSRRLDLSELAAERPEEAKGKGKVVDRGEDGEAWSPWKDKHISRATPQKSATPSRVTDTRDVALPSLSPFRLAPPSQSSRAPASGLTRSATTANLGHRAESIASDVSMGNSVTRAGSARIPRASSTMRLSAALDDDDDKMSVDGERLREGSVLSWFMQDRWKGVDGPMSPASAAASKRLGSAPPPSSLPPIRKGQMVWDADKGFIRKSELEAEVPKPIQQNDAERILFALESMRKPTPHEVSKTSGYASLPPGLIGSSSRSIRKAIAVPLATVQAEENNRKAASLSHRRELSTWTEDTGVSTVISPYGRRKQVDRAAKEERRERIANERQATEPSQARNGSADISSAHNGRRSASRTPVMDDQMSVSDRGTTLSPSPGASAPTPRRSARNKGKSRHMDVDMDHEDLEPVAEEPTPKVRRSSRRTHATTAPAPAETTSTPSKGKGSRRRKASSPPPEQEKETTPPPPVPTITATAPSPGDMGSAPPSRDGSTGSAAPVYEVRADNGGPRERSSLRVRSEPKHRQHAGSASYNSSRATSPSGTSAPSGRYSARDEDLPQMEDLEQAKIPLTSFASISFPLFAPQGGNGTAAAPEPASTKQAESTPLLASRIGGAPAPTPAAQQPASLSVPPKTGISRGSLTRLNSGLSTRPRASSPLAANSIVAEPESPPTTGKAGSGAPKTAPASVSNFFATPSASSSEAPAAGSTTPAGKPPATSSFSFAPATNGDSATISTAPKPVFSFGLGQPPASSTSPAPPSTDSGAGGIPNFFGSKSASNEAAAPAPSSTAPAPIKAFDFGIASKPAEALKPIPSTFSFGAPASTAPSSSAANADGSTPAPFSFGAKTSEPSSGSSSLFGSPAPSAAPTQPAEAPKPAFSFGQTSNGDSAPKASFSFGDSKPASETTASKPAFSFGAPSTSTPASNSVKDAAPASKPAFSFGSSTPAASSTPAPTDAAPTSKPAFSFGNSSSSAPAFGSTTASTVPAAAPASTGFSFGKPSEPAKDTSVAAPAASPFGAPSPSLNANGSGSGSTGFSFGQSKAPAASSSTPSSLANGTSGTSEPAKSTFSFGSTSTPSSSTFSFGAPSSTANSTAPAPAVSSPFGAPQPPPSQNASSPFGFGSSSATTNSTAPANPAFSFGATGSSTTSSTPFGQPAQAQSQQPSFSFGASSTAAPAPSSGFGSTNPFGSTATSTTPTSSTPSFTFGAPSAGGSSSSPAPSQPFTFGTPAPQTPGAAAPGVFSFGAPGGGGSTTPSGAPPAAFQFGSSAPANGAGAAGAGSGVRFGSPVPAASPAPDGGAFSLGMAPSEVPGSPSGRKIKPLRRGAVKR